MRLGVGLAIRLVVGFLGPSTGSHILNVFNSITRKPAASIRYGGGKGHVPSTKT